MPVTTPFVTVAEYITHLEQLWQRPLPPHPSVTPTVSIISPFFNAHRYFEMTYRSVYHQTFQDFEWLIVDDASTEPEAIALLETLPQRAPNLNVIHHSENRGPSAARNRAIAKAQGQYLFFLDPDDLIAPTYLEKCVLFLEAYPDFSLVNAYGGGFQEQDYWWSYGFEQGPKFLEQNWITAMLLYRKTAFDALGGFDETLWCYEDWERWLRALTQRQRGWTIPEYLQFYRRTTSGLLGTGLRQTQVNQQVIQRVRDRYRHVSPSVLTSVERTSPRFNLAALRATLNLPSAYPLPSAHTRVLCLFPHLEMGGADRFNLDCIHTLQQRGYGVTIATTLIAQNPWQCQFERLTSDIFHLALLLDNPHWLAVLKYLIISRNIDLVLISNSYAAYYFLPLLHQAFPDVAFVDYTHAIDPDWRGKGYPRLSCQFTHYLDCQVVSSQALATAYREMGAIAPAQLSVCYTGIDPEQWQPNVIQRQSMRQQLQIPNEAVVLLYPARFVMQKRPMFLVDVVRSLVRHTPHPIRVLAVGEGELSAMMTRQIRGNRLTNTVQIVPPVAPEDMPAFYAAADLLLLPSAYEGLSLSLYEAMAMALPVVASAVGGQGELVTPETGVLIPLGDGDAAEIAAYRDVLIPLIADAQRRRIMGDRARQRVIESFGLDSMTATMDAIFQDAIAQRRQANPKNQDDTIATELLLIALEYLHQEQFCSQLWQQNQELKIIQAAMQSSKFWKIRQRWIKLKQALGFATTEIM